MKDTLTTTVLSLFADAKLKLDGLPNATAGSENTVLTGLLNTVYSAGAIVAVIAIIYGGFIYVMSQGSSDKIKKAKNTIMYAVVGLIVVMSAFAITWFVSNGVK